MASNILAGSAFFILVLGLIFVNPGPLLIVILIVAIILFAGAIMIE